MCRYQVWNKVYYFVFQIRSDMMTMKVKSLATNDKSVRLLGVKENV